MASAAEEHMKQQVAAGNTGANGEGAKPPAGEKSPGGEAVDKLKDGDRITPSEEAEATAWYLDPDNLDQNPTTHTFKVDIAPYKARDKKLVDITIQPLDRQYIQQIRKENTRREGTREETNDMGINLALVVASLVEPDLRDPKVRGQYQDPADVLRLRLFRHKSGLIDQIANKVMAVSGYDDDDVLEVEAAKNS